MMSHYRVFQNCQDIKLLEVQIENLQSEVNHFSVDFLKYASVSRKSTLKCLVFAPNQICRMGLDTSICMLYFI